MNLASVDLNLFVALDALLADRSVSRAASRMGLTQPGMSNALARLRKLLDDPLMVRNGNEMTLTPRAEELAQSTRTALEILASALADQGSFDPTDTDASFTLSCSDYSLLILIAPLVRRMAIDFPRVNIRVLPRLKTPAELLRAGTVDFVVEPEGVIDDPGLSSLPLFSDHWVCCVWGGSGVTGEYIALDSYLKLGHIIYSMGRDQPVSIPDQYFARGGVTRRVEFMVENFLLTPTLLQGTELVSLVPSRAAPYLQRTADVRFLEPVFDVPTFTERLWWGRHQDVSPSHSWLRSQIAEVSGSVAGASDRPRSARRTQAPLTR